MLFNSSAYLFLFFPCAVTVYFLLNRRRAVQAATAWLVLASLFFYGYLKLSCLPIIVSSILVNFSCGTLLRRRKTRPQGRFAVLVAGVLFNLALLGCFKYADFFLGNVNNLFRTSFPLPHLALPLAISFFTFQQIAYLIDCGRENAKEDDFLSYCLFVSFFPQLLAGPISRRHELMPQFSRLRNRIFSSRNAALGIFFFSAGLVKKVWIADQFSGWASAGFAPQSPLAFFDAWGASLSYTFQLYFDFSGYTDMAVGSALFFNIVLPINFDSPYQSTNIQDFWRRWHITLSRWLRDYLYIPLGGSRKGQLRTGLNLLITFLLAGLWHGAGWTFVVWGLLHGAALVIHRLWKGFGLKMPAVLGWLTTFLFVNASWVIFRAENLREGFRVLKGMANISGIREGTVILPAQMHWHLLVFGLVLFLLPNASRIGGLTVSPAAEEGVKQQNLSLFSRAEQFLFRFRPNCFWALLTGTLFSLALYRLLRAVPAKFLYFNF